jgi:hypothetical protein
MPLFMDRSVEAVEAVHRESHGNVASRVIEVNQGTVEAFLGHLDRPTPGEPYVATAFRPWPAHHRLS